MAPVAFLATWQLRCRTLRPSASWPYSRRVSGCNASLSLPPFPGLILCHLTHARPSHGISFLSLGSGHEQEGLDVSKIYLRLLRKPQVGMKGLRACDILEGLSNKGTFWLTKTWEAEGWVWQ